MPSTTPARRFAALAVAVTTLAVPFVATSGSPSQAEPAATASAAVPAAAPVVAPAAARERPLATGPAAEARRAIARPSAAHPYSDPVWLPVRETTRMSCYKSNSRSRCGTTRDWQLDLLAVPYARVGGIYAMGAGRFNIRQIGKECGRSGDRNTLGTIVEIYHGGGVTSRYTHIANRQLHRLRALDGKLVAAGQWIGWMGMTGAGAKNPHLCGHANYIDFWVQRGPRNTKFEIRTLRACVDGQQQIWPGEQYPRYRRWNQLPPTKLLPREERAEEIPDSSCIPGTAPATVRRPARPLLRPAGGKLVARWHRASGATRTQLDIQVQRRGGAWVSKQQLFLRPRQTSFAIQGGSVRGRTVRVVVAHQNRVGWSANSAPSAAARVPR